MKVCGYSDSFCKNLNQRSLTPRWPLTPHLLRSHVWLYPRIIVSKSHENTSKYVDTVNLFAKTWTKGHWPLDDLWPHVSWGHMCDSTQGSLCSSPMTVHQCMWIQWSILQNTTYIHTHTYYVHTTYILHTTYRMSDHIVSYWTQFRGDNNYWTQFRRDNYWTQFRRDKNTTIQFISITWSICTGGCILHSLLVHHQKLGLIHLFTYLKETCGI